MLQSMGEHLVKHRRCAVIPFSQFFACGRDTVNTLTAEFALLFMDGPSQEGQADNTHD